MLPLRDAALSRKGYMKVIKNRTAMKKSSEEQLAEAIQNQIMEKQLYPVTNEEIIQNTGKSIWLDELTIFDAHYSMGSSVKQLTSLYEELLVSIQRITEFNKPDYMNFLKCISLAVLLGKPEDLIILGAICERWYSKDSLLMFLLWQRIDNPADQQLVFEIPCKNCMDVIELAAKDPSAAQKHLRKYLNSQWKIYGGFKKYYNKEAYAGNWCYEAGALVKLLQLNDFDWETQDFYPFDLVYKVSEE